MTELQHSQEKQAALMKNLMRTLMRAVDLHDPNCAGHSERTAQVAVAIGRELRLDDKVLEQLELAASLANVGKLFVPKELLTKMEPLTPEEHEILKQHVIRSGEILSGLEFDGPVLDIISQKHEYPDGSGYPHGLRGEQMLPEGKILAAANAFVAMVSARAYRPGMDMKAALDILLKESDGKYDRHIVAALFHVAENRPEWIGWAKPAKPGDAA
jgi:HD-GYP domain-containing protein (c-di-GMP phosphodiesterase class II)